MLSLASMIMAAYMYLWDFTHTRYVPQPVVIETGQIYKYDDIQDAIYVPHPWNDSCFDQKRVVFLMAVHYNNFKNTNQKMSAQKMQQITNNWKCVT